MFYALSDNFLLKVDRASMAYGLEVRSPFLDCRFIDFSSRLPVRWKTTLKTRKVLMRKMIAGMVPDQIVKRKKQGFLPPLTDWIIEKEYIKEIILIGLKLPLS